MDKQKQIEEMARVISVNCGECYTCKYQGDINCVDFLSAEELYNAGYRKIPENAVVLTREEYKTLKDLAMDKCHYDCHLIDYPDFERERMLRDDTRKETAEKFAERLKAIFKYEAHQQWIDEICKEITEG